MTLNDRINKQAQSSQDAESWKAAELSPIQEEAFMKCLCMCAEFQYLMRMRDLQH
jgi:hypothetical protein